MSSSEKSHIEASPLLSLPSELLLRVFSFLCTGQPVQRHKRKIDRTSLFLTCRTVYGDLASAFYENATFMFPRPIRAIDSISDPEQGDFYHPYLRRVTVRFSGNLSLRPWGPDNLSSNDSIQREVGILLKVFEDLAYLPQIEEPKLVFSIVNTSESRIPIGPLSYTAFRISADKWLIALNKATHAFPASMRFLAKRKCPQFNFLTKVVVEHKGVPEGATDKMKFVEAPEGNDLVYKGRVSDQGMRVTEYVALLSRVRQQSGFALLSLCYVDRAQRLSARGVSVILHRRFRAALRLHPDAVRIN